MKKPEEILLDMELQTLTEKLAETQKQVDNLLKATDELIKNEPLALQFFVRVNAGKLVEAFSEMAKSTFTHVDNLKRALEENKKMQDAAKKVSVPPAGQSAQEG